MNLEDIKVGESYLFTHFEGAQPPEIVKVTALPSDANEEDAIANSFLFPGEYVIDVVDESGEEGLVFARELSPVKA